MPWDITLANAEILAVHAALLPTGRILYFGGSEHNQAQNQSGNVADLDNSRLYNPDAPAPPTTIGSPTTDVFCSGHAFLPDGRLLVGGGTKEWLGEHEGHPHGLNFLGERAVWMYHPRANRWEQVADLNFEAGSTSGGGRWYPTLVTLANGNVLAVSGHPFRTDSRHNNDTPERYVAGADQWVLLSGTPVAPGDRGKYYPRVHLLPDGNVFLATPSGGSCRVYDPMAGAWVGPGLPTAGAGLYDDGWDYAAVLLPLLPGDDYRARVLVCGDRTPRVIDPLTTGATWQDAGVRDFAGTPPRRRWGFAVLLPTGDVFVCGGLDTEYDKQDALGVLDVELYTPGIDWAAGQHTGNGSWDTRNGADASPVVRNYHSTALLQPDGRVWTAGSSKNADAGDPTDPNIAEMRVAVFRPPYDDDPARPEVTSAPPNVGYGQRFEVRTPQAGQIERVAFMRAGSMTHAFDADQRYVVAEFQPGEDAEVLVVTAPPHGAVAPPGHYMLWLVDDAGRPCRRAPLIRLSDQRVVLVMDRSTFSTHEVEALGGMATFSNAFYTVLDGYLPNEVGTPVVQPTFAFVWADDGTPVPGLRAEINRVEYEDPAVPPDVAQRITFACNIRFDNADAFAAIPVGDPARGVVLTARHGANAAIASITLSRNPNPYMRDGQVHWLSTDLRVFALVEGSPMAGLTLGAGQAGALDFVTALTARFDTLPDDEDHPFRDISTDAETSQLFAASTTGGQPVHNFAVAKVRLRAPAGVSAEDARVFFRLFTTAATDLEYTTTAYPRVGDGAAAVPMLGLAGGEILSIPFFAEERRPDLRDQVDVANRKTLAGAGADEVVAYFGCWLDFNQPTARFPLNPPHDGRNGPFAGSLLSLQELLRNHHCCLAAEVHYPLDPIPTGATPGSHENLSQRNLVVVPSDNPGTAATHTVQSTFEARSSRLPLVVRKVLGRSPVPADELAVRMDEARVGPDELLIRWGNLPRDSRAVVYLPGIDTAQVAAVAAQRNGPPIVADRGNGTLVCSVGGTTWIPLPGPQPLNLAGLLTIELPPTVHNGEHFSVVVHQITSAVITGAYRGMAVHGYAAAGGEAVYARNLRQLGYRKVIGTFQVDIPVHHGAEIVEAELSRLAVLKHIAQAIPVGNRWYPVFVRYLDQIGDRIRGFGVDPADVPASPEGWVPVDGGGRHPGDPHPPIHGGECHEGRVRAVEYDRCGQATTVVLECCDRRVHTFRLCGNGLDDVFLRACRDGLPVRVVAKAGVVVGVAVVCC